LSEPLAQRLFPDGNAVGQRLTLTIGSTEPRPVTVVGVTADVVTSQMGTPRPQLYLPLAQHSVPRVTVIARSSTSLESAQSIFQQALPSLDRQLVQTGLVTGDALISKSMWDLASHSAVAGGC